MVKREDVQWGKNIKEATTNARITFFYTNAVPQHADLNQKIWRTLEDYILHTETRANDLKISVFTGPVLSKNDPFFVTEVKGQKIKIPTLFWKIIYFTGMDKTLKRVGFLMGQKQLLIDDKVVIPPPVDEFESIGVEQELFTDFEAAETYQVNVQTIENLTQMKFHQAKEPFEDERPLKLILEETEIPPESEFELAAGRKIFDYKIMGLRL